MEGKSKKKYLIQLNMQGNRILLTGLLMVSFYVLNEDQTHIIFVQTTRTSSRSTVVRVTI